MGKIQDKLDSGQLVFLSIDDAEAQAMMKYRIRQDLLKCGEELWKRLLG